MRLWGLILCLAVGAAPCPGQSENKGTPPARPAQPGTKPTDAKPEEQQSKGYPTIALERKGGAADVIRTARKVMDEAKCDRCKGDGEVLVEDIKYPRSNPRTNVPFKEGKKTTRKERCSKCSGSGFCADKSIEVAMDALVKAVCAMKAGDPKEADAMDRATAHLQTAFKGKFTPAAKSFGELAKKRTNDQPLKTGVPVYWVGYLMDDPAAADGQPLRIGVMHGSADAVCWISEPMLCRAAKGEMVIVGGLFAGRHVTGGNGSVPVAQGGWVVRME